MISILTWQNYDPRVQSICIDAHIILENDKNLNSQRLGAKIQKTREKMANSSFFYKIVVFFASYSQIFKKITIFADSIYQ